MGWMAYLTDPLNLLTIGVAVAAFATLFGLLAPLAQEAVVARRAGREQPLLPQAGFLRNTQVVIERRF